MGQGTKNHRPASAAGMFAPAAGLAPRPAGASPFSAAPAPERPGEGGTMITTVIPVQNGTHYLVRYGRQVVRVEVYSDGVINAMPPRGRAASRRAIRSAVDEVKALLKEQTAPATSWKWRERWWPLPREERASRWAAAQKASAHVEAVEGDRFLLRFGRQVVAVTVEDDGSIRAAVPLGHKASPRAILVALREVKDLVQAQWDEWWQGLSEEERHRYSDSLPRG